MANLALVAIMSNLSYVGRKIVCSYILPEDAVSKTTVMRSFTCHCFPSIAASNCFRQLLS